MVVEFTNSNMFFTVCIVSEWILVVFAIASLGLIFALAFKSKEYPTNFALLAAFVSIV